MFDEKSSNSTRGFLARKPVNINVLRYVAPKLALVPASCYTYDLSSNTLMSVPSCIRIARGSDGGPGPQINKGLRFARKLVKINVSRSSAPKIALVPASHFDVKLLYVNVCAKFH